MKKYNAEQLTYDIYYKILELCISDNPTTRADIAVALNISENSIYIKHLLDTSLIMPFMGDTFQITAQGLSTFLSIQAQKRADKQAKTATYIALASLIVAVIAIGLNLWQIIKLY